jgi:AcrR family transcriptional regulator
LVEAAWKLFVRKGRAVTLQEILAEADMSEGDFFRYFSSKEALINVVAMERVDGTLAMVAAEGEPGEADRSLLVRFVVEILSRPAKTPELVNYRAKGFDDPETRESLGEFNRAMVRRFAPLVRAAQQSGELEAGWDPDAVTELVDILVEGINRRHFSDTFATSFQRVGDSAIALLLGGLLVPEQRRG